MRLLILLLSGAVAVPNALAQEYTDYHGRWQGEMLFQIAHESGVPQGAPAVHAGTLDIALNGSVRGLIPGAGCALRGTSTEFVSSANASIDVAVDGCKDARFNGPFIGRLINNPVLKYASLRLSATRPSDSGTTPQMSAILRR